MKKDLYIVNRSVVYGIVWEVLGVYCYAEFWIEGIVRLREGNLMFILIMRRLTGKLLFCVNVVVFKGI